MLFQKKHVMLTFEGLQKEAGRGCSRWNVFFQETFEKASLSSSSSGAASLKSELSESADLPPESFQASKDEDRACDEILSDDNFNLENIEKGTAGQGRGRCLSLCLGDTFLLPGSFASHFPASCADIYSELEDELDISDNCSSSSSSPLKESTFSKFSLLVCGLSMKTILFRLPEPKNLKGEKFLQSTSISECSPFSCQIAWVLGILLHRLCWFIRVQR